MLIIFNKRLKDIPLPRYNFQRNVERYTANQYNFQQNIKRYKVTEVAQNAPEVHHIGSKKTEYRLLFYFAPYRKTKSPQKAYQKQNNNDLWAVMKNAQSTCIKNDSIFFLFFRRNPLDNSLFFHLYLSVYKSESRSKGFDYFAEWSLAFYACRCAFSAT